MPQTEGSSISYAIETYQTVQEEMRTLVGEHWEEIAVNKDKIKLNPDWESYEHLSDEGYLGIYTARSNGALVGYFIVVATPNIHYKDHIFGVNDVLFLQKKYRKGLTGVKLIKFAEKDLKEKGVSVLVINTKVHTPFDKILERMKYSLIERVYSKYIGE